jgi:YD repeat-containing protein
MIDSSKKEGQCGIRQYDSIGNLVAEFANQMCIAKYFYKDKLLTESIHVKYGDDAQTDTTIFTYDKTNKLVTKVKNRYTFEEGKYSGYQRYMKIITTREYLNDTTILSKEERVSFYRNKPNEQKVIYDTLIYNSDGLLIFEINAFRRKTSYVYNDRKQVVSKTYTRPNHASAISKESFIYNKQGHLIREDILLYTKDGNYTDLRSIDYLNNANGLVEIYRLGPLNSIKYTYEYH